MAGRVVGFLDYGNALDNFDELVRLASQEDLDAINAIISERNEFTLFGHLPVQFATTADRADATLNESADEDQVSEEVSAVTSRRGLAWMMALARVEFGAIVAGFTTHPDPYVYVTPESYDYAQSLQLLLEGVDRHYAALKSGTDLANYLKNKNKFDEIKTTLALSRRVGIARAMMIPLAMSAPERSRFSTDQANSLAQCNEDLDSARDDLNLIIRQFLAENSGYRDTTVTNSFVNACGQQLEAERLEIKEGIATITRFPIEPAPSQDGSGKTKR